MWWRSVTTLALSAVLALLVVESLHHPIPQLKARKSQAAHVARLANLVQPTLKTKRVVERFHRAPRTGLIAPDTAAWINEAPELENDAVREAPVSCAMLGTLRVPLENKARGAGSCFSALMGFSSHPYCGPPVLS